MKSSGWSNQTGFGCNIPKSYSPSSSFWIQPCLSDFFDRVLVIAKENKLRRNRLVLLMAISKVLLQIADYSQVVVEGEKRAARK